MSHVDYTFKQARCQAIVRACEGQTEEWISAFQGQQHLDESESGACMPPPGDCAAASNAGTSVGSVTE
eukprot:722067-Amphidinium_carterae.2